MNEGSSSNKQQATNIRQLRKDLPKYSQNTKKNNKRCLPESQDDEEIEAVEDVEVYEQENGLNKQNIHDNDLSDDGEIVDLLTQTKQPLKSALKQANQMQSTRTQKLSQASSTSNNNIAKNQEEEKSEAQTQKQSQVQPTQEQQQQAQSAKKQVATNASQQIQQNKLVRVAFEGYGNEEKVRLSKMLKEAFDMETVNMPTKLYGSKIPVLIVSKYGDSKELKFDCIKAVVNSQWVEESVLKKSQQSDFEAYGYLLSEHVFFIYDTLDPQGHPDQHSYHLKQMIQRQNGKVLHKYIDLYDSKGVQIVNQELKNSSDKINKNVYVVIKQQRRDFKEACDDVELLIKQFKVTFKQYEQMNIISDSWITKSIMGEQLQDTLIYSMNQLFNMICQGDRSVFYQPVVKVNELKSSNQNGKGKKYNASTNIPALMEQWTKYGAHELTILSDCVISFFGSDQNNQHAYKLANLLGANLTDSIIPTYTTHIITDAITPQLKQSLTLLQNRSSEMALKTSRLIGMNDLTTQGQIKVIGQSHTFKLVTIQWLEECLIQEKLVKEDLFTPEYVNDSKNAISEEEMLKFRRQQYKAKSSLFKNKTFSIQEEGFDYLEEEKEVFLEQIIQIIMEAGGKVFSSRKMLKTHYLICEDGCLKDFWNTIQTKQVDELDRKIVHYRWLKHCIKVNAIIDNHDMLYLYPLPQRVPIAEFNQALLLFTRCNNPIDEKVFKKLVSLYGFKYYSKEDKVKQGAGYQPTHIVVFGDEPLVKSTTVSLFLKKDPNNMPLLVNTEWLIDQMFQGKFVDVTTEENQKYIVALDNFQISKGVFTQPTNCIS
eukprot:403373677